MNINYLQEKIKIIILNQKFKFRAEKCSWNVLEKS